MDNTLMVKNKGGYQNLEKYIEDGQKNEKAQMDKLMKDPGMTWDKIVVSKLKKYKANQSVIENYLKRAERKNKIKLTFIRA